MCIRDSHSIAKPLPAAVSRESVAERLPHHVERLQSIVGAHVRQFGDRVNCPLSGGLDSRLLLASLRAAGCTPNVYVYGDPGDADVDVALAIGAAEGFAVDYVDKGRPAPSPEDFPALVESNFHDLDALPTKGNIFDAVSYAHLEVYKEQPPSSSAVSRRSRSGCSIRRSSIWSAPCSSASQSSLSSGC